MWVDFDNPYFHILIEWPVWIKILLATLLFALMLCFAYLFVFRGELTSLVELDQRKQELNQHYKINLKQVKMLEQLKVKAKVQGALIHIFEIMMPKEDRAPALLEKISSVGRESGVTFETLKLLDEKSAPHYVEIPIRIVVNGSYHQFSLFINKLLRQERLLTIQKFDILPKASNKSRYVMRLLVHAYFRPKEVST